MSVTYKNSVNPKIGLLLCLISVISLAFLGCDNDWLRNSGQPDKSSEAVSGAEDEIMKTVAPEDPGDGGGGGGGGGGSTGTTTGAQDFLNLLGDLSAFSFYIEEERDINFNLTSATAKIGVDTSVFAPLLANLNRNVKDTRFNKVDISSFSIERMENQFIYLKGRIHVQAWENAIITMVKVADKWGDIRIQVELIIDHFMGPNGKPIIRVGYAYAVTDVDLDRTWKDFALVAVSVLIPGIPIPIGIIPSPGFIPTGTGVIINEKIRHTIVTSVMEDGRKCDYAETDKINIDPEYFKLGPVTSSGTWLYFNFTVSSKGLDLIRSGVTQFKLSNPMKFVHVQNKYTKIYPTADAFISSAVSNGVDYTNSNYGTYPYFMASSWTYQGRKGDTRSLMMFATSSLPGNIIAARLYMFGIGHNPLTNSNACYLQRVTSSWSESSVTWNSQPSVDANYQVAIGQLTAPTADYSVDLSSWVKKWKPPLPLFGTWDNYGMMLRLASENYYAQTQFGSRDNADATKRPYLLVKHAVISITN